ncbi:alanine acetyltransferase, partial [Xanthomonas sp. Kuri4-1]
SAPVRRSRVGLPDRLQMALLRACGRNPADPQTQQLMATWPLAELRGNPAAKRALWPQLRALRRKAAP